MPDNNKPLPELNLSEDCICGAGNIKCQCNDNKVDECETKEDDSN